MKRVIFALTLLLILAGCGPAVPIMHPVPVPPPPPRPITPSPPPTVIPEQKPLLGRPFDDPTRLTVSSCSDRATIRVRVGDRPEFVLLPRGVSRPEDIPPLDIGDHEIRAVADVPTQIGFRSAPLPLIKVRVRANGTSQHFCLRE